MNFTPNIDALARDGTTFLNAYTQWPQCAPSRASFMSGRYPANLRRYYGALNRWEDRWPSGEAYPLGPSTDIADHLTRSGFRVGGTTLHASRPHIFTHTTHTCNADLVDCCSSSGGEK